MKVLVAYDGSLDSKAALEYGIRKVREYGGELLALHVFPSHLFIDYGAGPKSEAVARLEAMRHVAEARRLLGESGRGIPASLVLMEGNFSDETLRCSKEEDVDLIVAPPALDSLVEKACCLTDIVSAQDESVPELSDMLGIPDSLVKKGTWPPS